MSSLPLHVANLITIFPYSGCAFLIGTCIFPDFIRFLQNYKLTKKIREQGLSGGTAELFRKLHSHKSGTPTMGGIVILLSVLGTVVVSRILAYFGWSKVNFRVTIPPAE